MDRRNFLRALAGASAGMVAQRVFPFRVFSFPTDVQIVPATIRLADVMDVQIVIASAYELFRLDVATATQIPITRLFGAVREYPSRLVLDLKEGIVYKPAYERAMRRQWEEDADIYFKSGANLK